MYTYIYIFIKYIYAYIFSNPDRKVELMLGELYFPVENELYFSVEKQRDLI